MTLSVPKPRINVDGEWKHTTGVIPSPAEHSGLIGRYYAPECTVLEIMRRADNGALRYPIYWDIIFLRCLADPPGLEYPVDVLEIAPQSAVVDIAVEEGVRNNEAGIWIDVTTLDMMRNQKYRRSFPFFPYGTPS